MCEYRANQQEELIWRRKECFMRSRRTWVYTCRKLGADSVCLVAIFMALVYTCKILNIIDIRKQCRQICRKNAVQWSPRMFWVWVLASPRYRHRPPWNHRRILPKETFARQSPCKGLIMDFREISVILISNLTSPSVNLFQYTSLQNFPIVRSEKRGSRKFSFWFGK